MVSPAVHLVGQIGTHQVGIQVVDITTRVVEAKVEVEVVEGMAAGRILLRDGLHPMVQVACQEVVLVGEVAAGMG